MITFLHYILEKKIFLYLVPLETAIIMQQFSRKSQICFLLEKEFQTDESD